MVSTFPDTHLLQKLTKRIRGSAETDRDERTDQSTASGDKLESGRVPPGKPGLEQYGEVAHFVRYLVDQDCERRQTSDAAGDEECTTQGQSVREVVDGVGQKVQVTGDLQESRVLRRAFT